MNHDRQNHRPYGGMGARPAQGAAESRAPRAARHVRVLVQPHQGRSFHARGGPADMNRVVRMRSADVAMYHTRSGSDGTAGC